MKTITITEGDNGILNVQSDGFTNFEMVGIFSVLADSKSTGILNTMQDNHKGTLVKDLDISLRLKRLLSSISIDALEQLKSITETDLYACGFGNMTIKELNETMKLYNLKLKSDATDK
jgi:DNA-directed RNA polymerase alpha subunit